MSQTSKRYDAIVIGSGFGGSFAASVLIDRGLRVLMLERGSWVERGPHNWEPAGAIDLTPEYSKEAPYTVRGEHRGEIASVYCVGGPSLFYGAVSLRMRESDFERRPGGDVSWPIEYSELEPYYSRAESVLAVAGDDVVPERERGLVFVDPTAPPRSKPYAQEPAPLSDTARVIARAAAGLGLEPFRLPLAINYDAHGQRSKCVACVTCDAFICAIGAKNDMASALLPDLIARGLEIVPDRVVVRLNEEGGAIRSVDSVDRRTGDARQDRADLIVLAAGALGSPHLLLASGLADRNPAGDAVGRYLMRHCNGMVYSLFPRPVNPDRTFHKQIGLHDFYEGVGGGPEGKLGTIQQIHSPPVGLAQAILPRFVHRPLPWILKRVTGLLAVAEDEPQAQNRVDLMDGATDRFGMPRLRLTHRYTKRDRAARRSLLAQAKRVMRAAGARLHYRHHIPTFSHAVGTVRMGDDARGAPLDRACRYRGVDNLLVVDGSVFPLSGGVNPSLTIAANALRVAELAVGTSGVGAVQADRAARDESAG